MPMPFKSIPKHRWRIWLPLLGISAFLALQEPPPDDLGAVVNPVERSGRSERQPTTQEAASILRTLTPREQLFSVQADGPDVAAAKPDLFGTHSWTPPPPAPPPPPPPPAPTAPPLPFTFIGKKLEDGQWEVYLSNGDFTYVARAGHALGANYQVQTIQPPNMTFVYLPLQQTQILAIGGDL